MSNDVSRRKFLEKIALGGAAGASIPLWTNLAAGKERVLPNRTLGHTGAKVSILAFGGGSRFLMYGDEEKGGQALNHALDLGITYVDTAYEYGNGQSETWVGKVMATRRKEVWLATKIPDRTRDAFMSRLEGSLKRLQTDHVDLLHIHDLRHADDLAKIEAPDGALKALLEAKEQKMARAIGMTSHTEGAVLAQAIERHPLDCVQMALNATGTGEFEKTALAAANRKGLGVIAMKVFGQEFLIGTEGGKMDVDTLLHFAMSLPVTAAVAGMPHIEMLEHNIELARNFKPYSPERMNQLRRDMGVLHDDMQHHLVGHVDAPTAHGKGEWV
jgi:aryl-alcohol dehydrogenase-like predicted oxidoreductase